MHPQRSLVIQGSFPAGGPRVLLPTGRPGQPARPVAQPAGSSHVTPLDPTRLNLGGAGGSALPEPVQRKMEAFFKTDFSDVRVHVGPQAPAIGALAFTLGSNIYFAPGQYNPQSVYGQQLLGHELSHVLQQRAGRVRNPQGSGVAVVQDPHLEAEADRLGRQAAAQPMMPVGGPVQQRPGLVQAKPAASLPGARPVAPHVQVALAAVGHPKAAWTPPVTRPAVQPKAGGHKIVVGTYMHRGPGAARLPAEAAGHTFVAVEGPGGRREAYGFSPSDPQRYDFQKDVGRLRAGVPGAVQRDDSAFTKLGVKTRTYDVSPEQARAALAAVAAYKTHPPAFRLARQDCGQFATEVLKAAKIDDFAGPGVKRPAEMYRQVQAPVASGAQATGAGPPSAGRRPPRAPHVQEAVAAVGQPKQASAIPVAQRPVWPATQGVVQPVRDARASVGSPLTGGAGHAADRAEQRWADRPGGRGSGAAQRNRTARPSPVGTGAIQRAVPQANYYCNPRIEGVDANGQSKSGCGNQWIGLEGAEECPSCGASGDTVQSGNPQRPRQAVRAENLTVREQAIQKGESWRDCPAYLPFNGAPAVEETVAVVFYRTIAADGETHEMQSRVFHSGGQARGRDDSGWKKDNTVGLIQSRRKDAEAKAYRWLLQQFERLGAKGQRWVRAQVDLHTSQGPCDSCRAVRRHFEEIINTTYMEDGRQIWINTLSDRDTEEYAPPRNEASRYGHRSRARIEITWGHGFETRHRSASINTSRAPLLDDATAAPPSGMADLLAGSQGSSRRGGGFGRGQVTSTSSTHK